MYLLIGWQEDTTNTNPSVQYALQTISTTRTTQHVQPYIQLVCLVATRSNYIIATPSNENNIKTMGTLNISCDIQNHCSKNVKTPSNTNINPEYDSSLLFESWYIHRNLEKHMREYVNPNIGVLDSNVNRKIVRTKKVKVHARWHSALQQQNKIW